jgi:hypothetical protein
MLMSDVLLEMGEKEFNYFAEKTDVITRPIRKEETAMALSAPDYEYMEAYLRMAKDTAIAMNTKRLL